MYFPIYTCTHVHTSTYLRVNNNNYYNNKNTQLKKNHTFYLFVEFFTCYLSCIFVKKGHFWSWTACLDGCTFC